MAAIKWKGWYHPCNCNCCGGSAESSGGGESIVVPGPTPNDGKTEFFYKSDENPSIGDVTANQPYDNQIIIPGANDGTLTFKDADGNVVGTFTADQEGDVEVVFPESFSGDYNDLDNLPDINDGRFRIIASDGLTVLGEFSANQVGNSQVVLPKVDFNDLENKPAVNDGQINVNAGDGLSATGDNATANQSGNTTRTLAVDTTWLGTWIDTNKPSNVPGNGKLTIKDSGGASLGEFTANQADNTEVKLPAGFSGSYNDLTDKPAKFPPADHTHPYVKLAGDNMTGNLTFNTDKIVLKADDGTATFGPSITVAGTIKISHGNSDTSNISIGNGLAKSSAGGSLAIGMGALRDNTTGKNNTAIGIDTLSENTTGEYNLAIGNSSMEHCESGRLNTAIGRFTLNQITNGAGNVAIGNGAGQDTSTGGKNVIIGNSAGQGLTTGTNNVAIGATALYGIIQVTAAEIEAGKTYTINQPGNTDWTAIGSEDNENGTKFVATGPGTGTGTAYLSGNTASSNIGIGNNALRNIQDGDFNTAIGASTLGNNRTGANNVAIGYNALEENQESYNTAIGCQALRKTTTGANNVAIGFRALETNTEGKDNTALGKEALVYNQTGSYNSAFGGGALFRNTTGKDNVAVGSSALHENSTGNNNTAIGRTSLWNNLTGNLNTALGHLAGNVTTTGADNISFSNCSFIGANSRASASNQVQLGDSSTTTYCYGAVNNRSDARDKTDIRDTILGLDFIKSLRPVDYRWDIREDYQDTREVTLRDGTVKTQVVAVPQDGSRSRKRFHHGLIAQEVKAAADAQGVDFAGYQDHSVDGGADVLSIGYTELIAPLIKAVQELSAENAELKERLNKAGI